MLSFTKTIDRAGRLIESRDAYNRRLRYEYTAGGRRSKMTWPDGFYVRYYYDGAGRLWKIIDREENLLAEYAYDEAGRVVSVAKLGLTTIYDYEDDNPGDNRGIYLDSVVNSAGNEVIDFYYSRDLAGNITTKSGSDGSIDYLYDKNYSLTNVVFEDETELVFTYDNLFNRVSIEYELDTTNYSLFENGLNQYSQIDAIALEYDDNGNLTRKDTQYYLYDSENQLLATYNLAGEPNETQVSLYSYDEFGRRISKAVATGVESTTGVLTESYLYDGFQAIGEYDESGEYIRRRFIYAAGIDEPIAMVAEPAHQGFFGFDEFSTIATSWLYDSNDIGFSASADFNQDGVIDLDDLKIFAADFYLDERPLLESPQYYGYAFDGLGSIVAITFCNDPNQTGDPNETAYLIETYTYDSFGTATIRDAGGIELSGSAVSNPYMFTARRYDGESGLYYYRFRMYDAELGRFLQTDPIGYYDSMNLYQYCGNNPINWVDPWGLFRFGYRPLDYGLPAGSQYYTWAFPLLRLALNYSNMEMYHEAGFYEDGSGDVADYGGSGKKEDPSKYTMGWISYNDNLMRRAQQNVDLSGKFGSNSGYRMFGHNCQDYCSALRREYRRLKREQSRERLSVEQNLMYPW